MALTLAEVQLVVPDMAICEWVKNHIPISHAVPYLDRSWPGSLLDARAISFPSRTRAPRYVELNTLHWPSGADRYSLGFFLASGEQAVQIRAVANGDDGTESNVIPLFMSADGQASAEELKVDVTLLKIVPLTQMKVEDREDVNNMMLMVVVDDRLKWQTMPAPDFAIPPYGASLSTGDGGEGATVPTWDELIDDCQTALGITITRDAVDADYLSPDPCLNVSGAPIGVVLEAICRNVGMRFVAKLDNTYHMMNAATARTTRDDDASERGAADGSDHTLRSLRAGGEFFADLLGAPSESTEE